MGWGGVNNRQGTSKKKQINILCIRLGEGGGGGGRKTNKQETYVTPIMGCLKNPPSPAPVSFFAKNIVYTRFFS